MGPFLAVSLLAAVAAPAAVHAQASPAELIVLVESGNATLLRAAGLRDKDNVQQAGTDVVQAAIARQAALGKLIELDPKHALAAALPEPFLRRIRASAPEAGPYLEQHGTWIGRAERIIEDRPGLRSSREFLSVASASGTFRVFFAAGEPAGVSNGATLTAKGVRVGRNVAAAKAAVLDAASAAATCTTLGEQRVAVLLVRVPGQATPDLTVEQVREYFFGTSDISLDGFWRDASYGKAWATGDVFGWFDLDRAYACAEDYDLRAAAIRAADAQVDFTRYNRVFIFFPRPAGGCEWAAQGTLGCVSVQSGDGWFNASSTWIAATSSMSRSRVVHLAIHEGGHNLGIRHATSRSFGEEALGAPDANGEFDEYGDPFSAMGEGLGHYGAEHKLRLKWLEESQVATITDAAEQTVSPMSSQAADLKALKIQRAPGLDAWLWVEYRRPIGPYDALVPNSAFSGALIHYADEETRGGGLHPGATALLDFTPDSADEYYDFYDAPLAAGKFWFDLHSNRNLHVLAATETGLTVKTSLEPGCATISPLEREHTSAAESGRIDIAAAGSCSWQAIASDPWITIDPPASGSGAAALTYRVAANTAGRTRKGNITLSRKVFSIIQHGASAAPDDFFVYPKMGRGPAADLSFYFGDPNGSEDLVTLRVNVTSGADSAGGCLVEYSIGTQQFRLADDAGTGWIGPKTRQQIADLENSQCKIVYAAVDRDEDGYYLDMTFALKTAASQDRKILASAVDRAGLIAPWTEIGLWTAEPNAAPAIVSITPDKGAGWSQVFQLKASDTNGSEDLLGLFLTFGSGTRKCEMGLLPGVEAVMLSRDDGSAAIGLMGWDDVISNSNCSIHVPSMFVTSAENEVDVRVPVTFKPIFAGTHQVVASAVDQSDAAAPDRAVGEWIVGDGTQQPPAITIEGVVNAASFKGGPVAPGEIVTIFGTNMGPAELVKSYYEDGWLLEKIGATEVYFDDLRAPLIYSSAQQVSVVVPYWVRGTTRLRVEYQGRMSNEIDVPVGNAAPGIFAYSGGAGQAVVVNQDNTLNTAAQPAQRGSIVTLFLTGEGATKRYWPTGRLPISGSWPVPAQELAVKFGGVAGQIDFQGLVYCGVLQVNVRVPESAPEGAAVPLVASVGGIQSAAGVTVALR